MPIDIQLTLQGGGAKFAVLLAAAEAVQELEAQKLIRVTRIAGTSAGAIVGAFLAAERPVAPLRARLTGREGQELIGNFPRKSRPAALLNAALGRPFWDDTPLGKWLAAEFEGLTTLNSLRKPLFVYSADLDSGGAETQTTGDVVTALLESAGLPFCFRTWRSGGQTVNVDGGLCENLPVTDLLADESYGRVIALAFPRTRSGRPNTLIQFAMSLLDVAMRHSVESARLRVGSDSVCTLSLPEDLTTFNFNRALDYLGSTEYDATKIAVIQWFKDMVRSSVSTSTAHFTRDVWKKPGEDLRLEMQKVARLYRSRCADERLRFISKKLLIIGNSLAELGPTNAREPDEVKYEVTFSPVDRPATVFRTTFSSPQGNIFFGKYSLELVKTVDSTPVPFEALASISPEREKDREIVIFFSPPLAPGTGPYSLIMQDQGIDFLAKLGNPPPATEYLQVLVDRTSEPLGELQMAIQIPKQIGNIAVSADGNLGGRPMNKDELKAAFGMAPLDFSCFGWVAKGVPQDTMSKVFFST